MFIIEVLFLLSVLPFHLTSRHNESKVLTNVRVFFYLRVKPSLGLIHDLYNSYHVSSFPPPPPLRFLSLGVEDVNISVLLRIRSFFFFFQFFIFSFCYNEFVYLHLQFSYQFPQFLITKVIRLIIPPQPSQPPDYEMLLVHLDRLRILLRIRTEAVFIFDLLFTFFGLDR